MREFQENGEEEEATEDEFHEVTDMMIDSSKAAAERRFGLDADDLEEVAPCEGHARGSGTLI